MLDAMTTGLEKTNKPFSDIPRGKGALSIMGKEGDTKYIWDKTAAAEVEAARATFNSLTGKGYLAFSVKGPNGDKDGQIREFDPNLERIIFLPQMQGG